MPLSVSSSLGLNLKLPPGTVTDLRRDGELHGPEYEASIPLSSDEDQPDSRSTGTESDEWEDVIATRPMFEETQDDDEDAPESVEVEQDEDSESDQSEQIDEDDISLSPPPSLPVIFVDLEKLVGYVPTSKEEAEQLQQQISNALWKDDDTVPPAMESSDDIEENLSRQFEGRAGELFETGVAFHGNNCERLSNSENSNRYAIVSYPDFLCRSDRQEVVVTARQWKRLLRSHTIPVVQRVLRHLAACSRPLSWKVDMNHELWRLASSEDKSRRIRKREEDLDQWRTQGRKEQLDKLYQVRETFDHRLEMGKNRLSTLEDERDAAATIELRRLRIQHGYSGGLEALDFDSTMFPFAMPGEPLPASTYVSDPDPDADSVDSSSVDVDNSYDGDDDMEDPALDSGSGTDTMPLNTGANAGKAVRRVARKHRRKLASQAEAAKLALEREKFDHARAEEERVKQALTSPQLRKAQAVVQSLQDRLEQVDGLLESLQEEEWADEEEGILRRDKGLDEREAKTDEMSLLDQILAMILGTLPPGPDFDTRQHFEYVGQEHTDIINQWRGYFGRLPSSSSTQQEPSTTEELFGDMTLSTLDLSTAREGPAADDLPRELTASEMRQSLNIIDNDMGNWDDLDDWDDANSPVSSSASTPSCDDPQSRTPKSRIRKEKSGLRPGGRI